jgi:hypothetical protein
MIDFLRCDNHELVIVENKENEEHVDETIIVALTTSGGVPIVGIVQGHR